MLTYEIEYMRCNVMLMKFRVRGNERNYCIKTNTNLKPKSSNIHREKIVWRGLHETVSVDD